MAQGITTAFWGMVINNYDETDLALVRNGYPEYMREIVHTLERGENGTPHIQAWIRLQRQQRLSFVKKLFPRANFKPLTSDEYNRNAKQYAQKLDKTAESAAVHKFNEPTHTIENVIKKVCLRMMEIREKYPDATAGELRAFVEREFVATEDYAMAKIFVSDTYRKMWKNFGFQMYQCVESKHTHTHTHTEETSSHIESINDDADDDERSGEGRRFLGGEHKHASDQDEEEGDSDEDGEESDETSEGGSESASETSGGD